MFKPKKTVDSFEGKRNKYIEYISEGDDYENTSPREYLDMIRPYLRDLIIDHKTPMKNDHITPIESDNVINNEIQFGE